MYNTPMRRMASYIILIGLLSGCAVTTEYNPIKAATAQTFILNEAALNNVRLGMTQDQVHAFMGQGIVIGYAYQGSSPDAKPLTINNPYKTAPLKTPQGDCVAEYYVTAVHQPDGIVSDDELMPLIFCNKTLAYKGWEHVRQ